MDFYVYIYFDPRRPWPELPGEPIYVGKGCGNRANQPRQRGTHIYNRLRAMGRKGVRPIIQKVLTNLSESSAFEWEVWLIAYFGRRDLRTGPLCNLTTGGEGGSIPGPISREKMRRAKIGTKLSPETRKKIGQSQVGRVASSETREKLSRASLGRIVTPETREKLRQANLGQQVSPETRKKLRQARLGSKHSAETREKLRGNKNSLGAVRSPETREKMRQAAIKAWERKPELREKMRQVQQNNLNRRGKKHTPEALAKMRAAKLGKKHTPETIEKLRQLRLGKTIGPETREKMRQAAFNRKKRLTPTPSES